MTDSIGFMSVSVCGLCCSRRSFRNTRVDHSEGIEGTRDTFTQSASIEYGANRRLTVGGGVGRRSAQGGAGRKVVLVDSAREVQGARIGT